MIKIKWVILCLSCCLYVPAAYANSAITVQLKWTDGFQFAGFYMALEQGYYDEAGLDVRLIEGGVGKSSVEHVVNNKNAYGVTSTGALVERSYGKPIKAVGVIFQHDPLMLMTRMDTGIKSLQDLRGKRVMIQRGYQNASILAALQAEDLHEGDFIRQDTSYHINDLIEKRTDAYAIYAMNQVDLVQRMKVPFQVFNPNEQGIDFYGDIVITSDEEVLKHPDRVQSFMAATALGWRHALNHPNEAIDLILLKYNAQHLSRSHLQFQAKEAAKFIMSDLIEPGYMNMFRWQSIANIYAKLDMLSADYPVKEFVYFPKLSVLDWIALHLWQFLVVVLFVLALIFAGISLMMRQLVKRKTLALTEREADYRKLLELVSVGVVVHRHGRILFANAYALTCFQVPSLQDVYGQDVMQYIHPDEREKTAERLQKVLHDHESYAHVASRGIGAGGRVIDTEIGSMMVPYHGELAVLTVVEDVTERKRAEVEAMKVQQRVEHAQRLESLGVLAGGIAHDFNNLLTAMLGHADMASAKVEVDPVAVKRHLKHVVKAAGNAASLCSQMLAYSGKGKFVVEAVNLAELTQEMLVLVGTAIDKKIRLDYQVEDENAFTIADVSQVQQVVMNLVTNASEAMAGVEGDVQIVVGCMHANEAYLKDCYHEGVKPGHFVYVEVSDTGCGMSDAVREKIFEPFYTTKFTGRGLGMSALLGIMRGHHGAIHLASKEHQGTCVRALFPQKNAETEQGESSALVAQAGQQQYEGKVLIVDDEDAVLGMAVAMFEEMGFETLVARNGLEGVGVYREHMQDITMVLLDLTMPVMGGAEAFRAMYALNSTVQVIVCSGYSAEDMMGRFEGQLPSKFIHKPYRMEDLQEVVNQLMPS